MLNELPQAVGGQSFWVEEEAEGDLPLPALMSTEGPIIGGLRCRPGNGAWSWSCAPCHWGRGNPQAGQGHLGQLWDPSLGPRRQEPQTAAEPSRIASQPPSPNAASFTSAQTSRFLLWLKPISRPDFAAELGSGACSNLVWLF